MLGMGGKGKQKHMKVFSSSETGGTKRETGKSRVGLWRKISTVLDAVKWNMGRTAKLSEKKIK